MPRSMRGLQSMPLAADGIPLLLGSYNQVFALDGAHWRSALVPPQKLDEQLVSKQTHRRTTRASRWGWATSTGHPRWQLVAIDMKTVSSAGKPSSWTPRADRGFTGAPLLSRTSHYRGRRARMALSGPIFGVEAAPARKYGSSTRGRQPKARHRTPQHLGPTIAGDRGRRRLDAWRIDPGTTWFGGVRAIPRRSTTGPARTG